MLSPREDLLCCSEPGTLCCAAYTVVSGRDTVLASWSLFLVGFSGDRKHKRRTGHETEHHCLSRLEDREALASLKEAIRPFVGCVKAFIQTSVAISWGQNQ